MSSTSTRRNSSNLKSSALNAEKDSSEQKKINDNNHVNSNVMNFPDAKWIHIFINGDEHFSGCRCVVNSKYYRNLDMFLNYLTERLKPSFGAFRNIYTPVNGHPVYRLEDLISKQKYVVAGNERFKKLDLGYTDADKKVKRQGVKPKNKFKVTKAKPQCHTLSIDVNQNGNFKVKPNKVSLLPSDLGSWESIFHKIRETMKCGPIKRLCTLNGKPVQSIEDLANNQSYVIISKHEIFKAGNYGLFSQKLNSSSKERHHFRQSGRKSSSVATGRSSGIYSQASAQSTRIGSTLSMNKKYQETYLEPPAYNTLNISELGNGVDSLDSFKHPQKQVKAKGSINLGSKITLDLDDDISGIFRSKTQNDLTAGATEIDDSSETVTDLPVDLLDAEEVDDEITPDMERSLQHLTLDVPEEIVAFLPSMQNNSKNIQNSDESQVSTNKYNLTHSQTLDIHNIYV